MICNQIYSLWILIIKFVCTLEGKIQCYNSWLKNQQVRLRLSMCACITTNYEVVKINNTALYPLNSKSTWAKLNYSPLCVFFLNLFYFLLIKVFGAKKALWLLPLFSKEDLENISALRGIEFPTRSDVDVWSLGSL